MKKFPIKKDKTFMKKQITIYDEKKSIISIQTVYLN